MPKAKTESEIIEILLNDPHILQIRKDKIRIVPDIDFVSKIKKDERKNGGYHEINQEFYYGQFQEFMNSPYIIDDFIVHTKRRGWINKLGYNHGEEVSLYLMNNSLRSDWFRSIINLQRIVNKKNYIGNQKNEFTNKLNKIKDLYQQLTDISLRNEDNKTVNDNFLLADKVAKTKNKVYSLLTFLSVD